MEKYSNGKGYVYIDPDNFIYSLKNYRGNRFYLYCHEKGCNGSSAIINDRIKHIRPHSHPPDEQQANMIKFKAVLKYRCQTELCKNVKDIFHEEKKTFSNEEVGFTAADFNKFKANMYRDRRRVAPNLGRKAKPSQTNKKTKTKKCYKFRKNDLKIDMKEEYLEEHLEDQQDDPYNQQSVNNTDENLSAFTDDIDNFSNEEILYLSSDNTELITNNENSDIIIPDNCCFVENAPEDCEHKKEIKTLRKKMISILKDHSYTNIGDKTENGAKQDGETLVEAPEEEMVIEECVVEHLEEEFQEETNLEVLSENDLSEFIVDPLVTNSTAIENKDNLTSQGDILQGNSSCPKKYTQLKSMDVEDQIVTNEIKLEILNSEDLRTEVDKLRKEVIILKKLLIEKERIIDSQEKYILLLENRR